MRIVLDPIIPSEAIEDALEREITEWFSEVIFEPIRILFDESLPNDVWVPKMPAANDGPTSQCGPVQIVARGNDGGTGNWVEFPLPFDSLSVTRANMPQITEDERAGAVEFLNQRGISSELRRMPAGSFKPTQSHYNPEKVQHWMNHDQGDQAILVSSDMRIMDGHHRWFAAMNDGPQNEMAAIVFNANAPELLNALWDYPGVVRDNAIEYAAISRALKSGRLSYGAGVFSGDLNASISRELRAIGAKFDPRKKVYRLQIGEVPYALRGSIAAARERSEAIHKGIIRNAGAISGNVAASPSIGINLEVIAERMTADLHRQFAGAVRKANGSADLKALDAITVPADFTPTMVEEVRRELTETLTLPIKNFTEEQTLRIRELAEENWNLGGRVDRLQEMIEERFGVAARKAKFLAKQETSMIASEFARARAEEIGSDQYVWYTREDDRVRHDHAVLDGKTFFWASPPVVDEKTGRTDNPGMDYNCRCRARAIINLSARRVA